MKQSLLICAAAALLAGSSCSEQEPFDAAMPEALRLGAFLDAEEIPVSEVRVGDKVWMREYESGYKLFEVAGFGDGRRNGQDMTGVPCVKRYGHDGDWSWNINNYVREDTCRIAPRS